MKICNWFTRGECKKGSDCGFIHDLEAQRIGKLLEERKKARQQESRLSANEKNSGSGMLDQIKITDEDTGEMIYVTEEGTTFEKTCGPEHDDGTFYEVEYPRVIDEKDLGDLCITDLELEKRKLKNRDPNVDNFRIDNGSMVTQMYTNDKIRNYKAIKSK